MKGMTMIKVSPCCKAELNDVDCPICDASGTDENGSCCDNCDGEGYESFLKECGKCGNTFDNLDGVDE